MHSYDDFPKDIKSAFELIIAHHDFSVSSKGNYSVDLENRHCRINFNMDRFDLQALIFKKNDTYSFGLWDLVTKLNPAAIKNDPFPKPDGSGDVRTKKIIDFYAHVVDYYLKDVINGNFNWYNDFKREKKYEQKLVGLILGPQIDHNHPISKKFWSGDQTWKLDIEEFIKEHQIELK